MQFNAFLNSARAASIPVRSLPSLGRPLQKHEGGILECEWPACHAEELWAGPEGSSGQSAGWHNLHARDQGYKSVEPPWLALWPRPLFKLILDTTGDQLDSSTYAAEGYNAYFSFCRTKSGYSGVCTTHTHTQIPVSSIHTLLLRAKNLVWERDLICTHTHQYAIIYWSLLYI